MSRLTGGNDPAFVCRARSLALVVPAPHVPRVNPKQDRNLIGWASRMDRDRLRPGALVGTVKRSMSKVEIAKAISASDRSACRDLL